MGKLPLLPNLPQLQLIVKDFLEKGWGKGEGNLSL
jgi:hypothetical protein